MSAEMLVAGAAIFSLGGLVKGVAGFGLPTVTLGLLALFRPLPEAMALALFPTIATNIWQAFGGGHLLAAARRLWGFLLGAAIGTLLGAGQLARADAARLTGLLGVLMMVAAGLALLGPRWPQPPRWLEAWGSPVMGLLSGGVAGLTGSFMMPATPWLAALRLPREEFIQGFGLGAIASTALLAVAMAGQGLLTAALALNSAAALVPALLGMAVGQRLRRALPEEAFRRLVQVFLAVLGGYLAVRAFR